MCVDCVRFVGVVCVLYIYLCVRVYVYVFLSFFLSHNNIYIIICHTLRTQARMHTFIILSPKKGSPDFLCPSKSSTGHLFRRQPVAPWVNKRQSHRTRRQGRELMTIYWRTPMHSSPWPFALGRSDRKWARTRPRRKIKKERGREKESDSELESVRETKKEQTLEYF